MIVVNDVHVPDEHHAEQVRKNPLYQGKGTYRWDKLARSLDECQRRGHAVDVGAHVGLWTRVLASEFERVTAVEPIVEFADLLRLNVWPAANVMLESVALGNESCREARFIRLESGKGTALRDEFLGAHKAPIVRMDQLLLDRIDFLKVSCEGAEHFVIAGGERTIRRFKPVIIIEQKPKRMAIFGLPREATVRLLESWGAQVAWDSEGDFCLRWPQ